MAGKRLEGVAFPGDTAGCFAGKFRQKRGPKLSGPGRRAEADFLVATPYQIAIFPGKTGNPEIRISALWL